LLADDVLMPGLLARRPGRYAVVGERLTREPYAVAVGPGEESVLGAANLALRRFKDSGEWEASYARNVGPAIPPPPDQARSLADALPASAATSHPAAGPLPLAPPGTALRRIQDRGSLVVAVKADVP